MREICVCVRVCARAGHLVFRTENTFRKMNLFLKVRDVLIRLDPLLRPQSLYNSNPIGWNYAGSYKLQLAAGGGIARNQPNYMFDYRGRST
jgi:hypothetical protein